MPADHSFPLALNREPDKLIAWFDDLGTGNETYRFLSNFYEGETLYVPGFASYGYRTGEHAFQAQKAAEPRQREAIANAPTPDEAKSRGRRVALREDWEQVKYDVMAAVVRGKFSEGRDEAEWLCDTGDAMLIEGTYWHDTVWGVDAEAGLLKGRNWLGTLLMARRAELRSSAREPSGIYNALFVTRKDF